MNIQDESIPHSAKPHTLLTVYRKQIADRSSYSLRMTEVSESTPQRSIIAEDVTENADAALSFAKLLAQEKISPHHFADIVEDSLPLK